MQNKSRLIPFLLLSLVLMAGCSSSDKPKVPDEPPEVLFQKAQQRLEKADYAKALELLEAMDSRYPFGPYSAQVQLDLIYAYYKNDDTAQALANIDRFLRLNPTHPDVDYVYYMRGLSNMQTDYNLFQSLAGVDRSDRDPAFARQAFRDFKTLLTNYPASTYAPDARARLIGLKNRLAKYDLAVADYYLRRQAWLSAANRAKFVVENYPDTRMVEPALAIMIRAYNELQLPKLAQHARQVLAANYPEHALARP